MTLVLSDVFFVCCVAVVTKQSTAAFAVVSDHDVTRNLSGFGQHNAAASLTLGPLQP